MAVPTLIQHDMEVLGSDGAHVGIVDCVEETNELKLAKEPTAGDEPHFIPLTWIMHVGMKVHLKQPGAEAKASWKTH